MFRRILAFILGMIFGMVLLLGGVVAGVYIALTTVTPSQIDAETEVYMGDLAQMSIADIATSLQNLYNQQLGLMDENGNYFTLGDFCAQYNIDTTAAFGVELPDDVLNIPLIEYFNSNTDENGLTGVQRALKQIKVSAIPAVVNLFSTEDENGNTAVKQNVIDELSNYNVNELLDESKGIAYVFQNVILADLIPNAFPSEDSDNALMWAFGQSKLGKMLSSFSSSDSIYLQFGEGGAFETLGSLKVTKLLGGGDELLQSILGDTLLRQIVDENGSVAFGGLLQSLYLGNFLSYKRIEVTDISDYTAITEDNSVLKNTQDQIVRLDNNGKYWVASLTCEEEHTHTAACYKYNWFTDAECTIPAEGLYAALVNITVEELTNGSADSILNELKNLKIGDILNGEITGIMANFADMTIGELMNGGVDGMYIGMFLGFTRTTATAPATYTTLYDNNSIIEAYIAAVEGGYVMSDNGIDWYNAKCICEEAHEHTRSCYSYIWKNGEEQPDGIVALFADKKVSQLNNIENDIMKLTLRDVLGDDKLQDGILKELADIQIGNISSEIDALYIGSVMGFIRGEVDVTSYSATDLSDVLQKTVNENIVFAKKATDDCWYIAELTCKETDASHIHSSSCYGYVWYNANVTENSEEFAESDLILDGSHHARVDGLYSALVNLTIHDLTSGSADAILENIKDLKISDIFSGEITGIMSNFADMTINELMNGGIDGIYLGSIIDFQREKVGAPSSFAELRDSNDDIVCYVAAVEGGYVMSDNGSDWYRAKLTCTSSHQHTRSCYSYIWLDGTEEADGLLAKFADKKLSEIDDLNSTVQKLTLRDMLDESQLQSGILAELADVAIGDISTKIDGLYLGSVMKGIRNEITDINGYTSSADGVLTNGVLFAKLDNGNYYLAELTCTNTSAEHTHGSDCYSYVWYNADALEDSHTHSDDELVLNGAHHSRFTGINKSLANLTLANIMSGSSDIIFNHIKNLTVGELAGENVGGIMEKISDMTIDELMNGGVETVYLGTFMNYKQVSVDGTAINIEPLYKDGVVVAYVGKIGGKQVMSENGKAGTWYEATSLCDEDHTHSRECFMYVWLDEDGVPSKGMMAKLADKKVGELQNMKESITSFTVSEILGDNFDGILDVVKDIPLKDLDKELDHLYFGAILKFYRVEVTDLAGFADVSEGLNVKTNGTTTIKLDDDNKWYVAELDCNVSHEHTDSCYNYIWYTDEACTERVGGVKKTLVNCTLSNINEKMDNLTLRELGIGGNNILDSLQDIPITELGTAINDLKLGVVFGFVLVGDVWYQPCESGCTHSDTEHRTLEGHDGFFTEASGLNGKMANKTMSDLSTGNGLTDIVTELTIRELIDSGMMSLGDTPADIEDNEYKFAIIFCDCDCGSITESIYGVPKTYGCNLPDYLIYKSSHVGVTSKNYYENEAFTHEPGCEKAWENLQLSEFVSALLSAIN